MIVYTSPSAFRQFSIGWEVMRYNPPKICIETCLRHGISPSYDIAVTLAAELLLWPFALNEVDASTASSIRSAKAEL